MKLTSLLTITSAIAAVLNIGFASANLISAWRASTFEDEIRYRVRAICSGVVAVLLVTLMTRT